MKTKNALVSLIAAAAVLAGIVALYELQKHGVIARKPMTISVSDVESYYNTAGTYRSVGPTSRVKQGNQFNWSLGGGTTDYAYVLGMKPGTAKDIQFDVLVVRTKNKDIYPPQLEIDNVLNVGAWDVQTLQLSFSVPVTKTYGLNPYLFTQGLPGVTHEIITGKGAKLQGSWDSTRAQMSGWDDGNTFLKDLGKVKSGEKDLVLMIALMGDEAFVRFDIQPPLQEADLSGNTFKDIGESLKTSWQNLKTQTTSTFKGDVSEPYVHYLVSTAALVGVFDCADVKADEPVEKTVVSGKPACALDTRRNSRRNALGDSLGAAGISTGLQEVIFEELGI